mmetsp:Transcript_559/g.742  ORF Transcript_559/g.742 Transcript_559/m.742 type:complete len:217 (-) Transcript_559:54-704(-)
MMTKEAKFDVGGTRYKVSRSLLELHPDTMLFTSASERWQEGPESEIFIERDGTRFRFVLDYLRDGKVTLPVTESKEAFIAELEYYGIKAKKCKIDDTQSKLLISKSAIVKVINDLEDDANTDEFEFRTKTLAMFCIREYFNSGINHSEAKVGLSDDIHARENLKELYCWDTPDLIMETVNVRIKCVGIKLTRIRKNQLVIKEIGAISFPKQCQRKS